MPRENVTLKVFFQMLNSHDWYYQFSDDYRVYSAGQQRQLLLNEISKQSPDHRQLYLEFVQHTNDKIAGKTPKPLPKEPGSI